MPFLPLSLSLRLCLQHQEFLVSNALRALQVFPLLLKIVLRSVYILILPKKKTRLSWLSNLPGARVSSICNGVEYTCRPCQSLWLSTFLGHDTSNLPLMLLSPFLYFPLLSFAAYFPTISSLRELNFASNNFSQFSFVTHVFLVNHALRLPPYRE